MAKHAMTGSSYRVVAEIVRLLPADVRQAVADHFATEFHARSPSFDAGHWNKVTGGKVIPGVSPAEAQRLERVKAYLMRKEPRVKWEKA